MQKLVVLSGAGISAESGLNTFRDANGLWEGHDITKVACIKGWRENRKLVLEFYNQRRRELKKVQPNQAHLTLKELELFFEVFIITQNVDDLHERSGSKNVLHLHGELFKVRSEDNDQLIYYLSEDLYEKDKAQDGSLLRPHIVWFGEEVPMMEKAADQVAQADVFLIIGTSLQVYPAASLLSYLPPKTPIYLIDVNKPLISDIEHLCFTQCTASEGMCRLRQILLKSLISNDESAS